MPLNFHFSTAEILWTLTFAALLVLLVVLLGRDRVRRYPWFTASIVLIALRMLASRLLFGKLAPLASSEVFLVLADVTAVVSFVVVVEMARRAFAGASRRAWIAGTLVLLAVGATVLALWGPWPSWKTLEVRSTLANLQRMQLAAQKIDLLDDVLAVELGLLLTLVGRRFKAGWRSHTQQIVLGLSTAAMAETAVRVIWQKLMNGPPPQSQDEYLRITGLRDKIVNANEIAYLVVLAWWIVCLWIDEPGSKAAVFAPAPEEMIREETPAVE
jgi:hypothetical protein